MFLQPQAAVTDAWNVIVSLLKSGAIKRSWLRPSRSPKRLMLCVIWLMAAPSAESSSQSERIPCVSEGRIPIRAVSLAMTLRMCPLRREMNLRLSNMTSAMETKNVADPIYLSRSAGRQSWQAGAGEKPLLDPPPGHVRIRVEACGVCHSDAGTVEGVFPIQWPRVPGHEAVGRVDALGEGVEGWAVGQRVGVGFLPAAADTASLPRRRPRELSEPGLHRRSAGWRLRRGDDRQGSGLMSVPDDLSSVNAAPLLCAGLTTFSALRNSPAKAGDLVAVLGIGGLGHLGVQYARHMGFEVAAIGRGTDKAELAKKLGAHHYIDSAAVNPAEALQALGGALVVLATASAGKRQRTR